MFHMRMNAPRVPNIRKESPVGGTHVGSGGVLACGYWMSGASAQHLRESHDAMKMP